MSEREPIGLLAVRVPFIDVTASLAAAVDFVSTDLRVGTKVSVDFRGERHTVYVVPALSGNPAAWRARGWGRYVYRDQRFKSLTAIARHIVGATDPRINGHRFFGLRRRRRSDAP